MRMLRFALLGALLLGFSACSKKGPDTSQYPSMITGAWKCTEGDFEGYLVRANDGKLHVTGKYDEDPFQTDGTYELEGDLLKLTVKNPRTKQKEQKTFKIQTLTKQELIVTEEEDETKVSKFRRP